MSQNSGSSPFAALFRQSRALWALRAVAALVIGVLVLVWPQSTVAVLATLLGIYFAILGIIRLVQGLSDTELNGGGKAANIILGALVLVLGVVVIRNPFETAVFLVVIVGISWIFEGVATLLETARGRGSVLSTVIGVLIAVAGVLVVFLADGVAIAYAVSFGITLIVVGILDFVLLVTVGKALSRASR